MGCTASVRDMDPVATITDVATGDEFLSEELAQPRHRLVLLGVFSAVALALAAVGLYGIVANSVHSRRREVAIRLALGGNSNDITGAVVSQGMSAAVVGILAGIAPVPCCHGVASAVVYDVSPSDPRVLISIVVLTLAVALTACFVPVRKALRTGPAEVLRVQV